MGGGGGGGGYFFRLEKDEGRVVGGSWAERTVALTGSCVHGH